MQNLKQQALATLDKIIFPSLISSLNSFPELQASMILIYGFFGVTLQYKQNEVNELLEFIINNPGVFTSEIVKTKEFQDGFVIIFENYIKERNNEKRKIIKNIFLGFTKLSEEEKEKFELERFLHLLNIMNEDEINYIRFLSTEIQIYQNELIKKRLIEIKESKKKGLKFNSNQEETESFINQNPLTSLVSKFFKEKIKNDEKLLYEKVGYYYQLKKQTSSLGIFSYHSQMFGGGLGSGGITSEIEHNFNNIGNNFIKYITE